MDNRPISQHKSISVAMVLADSAGNDAVTKTRIVVVQDFDLTSCENVDYGN